MSQFTRVFALSLATGLGLGAAAASAQTESPCVPPGVTVLTDAAGDWTGTVSAGRGTPETDLLSLSVAESGSGPDLLLHFTIRVASMPLVLTPYAAWYTSFETPSGAIYGVRLQADDVGAPHYFSYVPGASSGGTVDGRFVEDGTEKPAVDGTYTAAGAISITVKASDVGIGGKALVGPFNAATVRAIGTPATGAVIASTADQMPDTLGRDGAFNAGTCSGKDHEFLGISVGALPAATLALLCLAALAGLARRARA